MFSSFYSGIISKFGHNKEMVQLLPPDRLYVQKLLEADIVVDIIIQEVPGIDRGRAKKCNSSNQLK
ncbi:MAG: hypothetical protein IPP53_15280 [Bacteroidetes bacterium]|nr:hypothetical protein [Bacteroidota bacterium]